MAPSTPPSEATSFCTIDCADTWFSPIATYSAVTSARCMSRAIVTSWSPPSSRCIGSEDLRIARVSAVLPASTASSRRSLANHCRILVLARGEATKASQSRDGPAPSALEVNTSTVSP